MATRRFYTDIVVKSDVILANETIDTVPVFDGTKKIKSSTITTDELESLSGIDSNIQDQIDVVVADISSIQSEVDAVEADLAQEIIDREAADTTLQTNITSEATARSSADATLQSNITAEATARSAAISAEATARISGDASTLASANSYTDSEISNLINGAGSALDTLKELADALGDDPNFAATVATNIANEASRAIAAEDLLQDNIDAVVASSAGVQTNLTNHLNDTVDAHDASAISFNGASSGLSASEVQSAIDELAARPTGSPGDVNEGTFSFSNNQSTPTNITGFSFTNAVARSFDALVSVSLDATSNFYEEFEISGIQKDSDWDISITTTGDDSGVELSITSAGQMQYISSNQSGFVTGKLNFRAITTSV